jgi:SET domain-containing protein
MVSKTIERGALPWWAAINISMRILEVIGKRSKTYVANSPGRGRGLFAGETIPAGTVLFMDPLTMISDHDWELIKNTRFVKMYGLKWVGDTHAIPLGDIPYVPSSEEQRIFEKTQLFKNGVSLSSFLLVNHSDRPNSEEIIDIPNKLVGIKTLATIEPDQEIFKRYAGAKSSTPKKLEF